MTQREGRILRQGNICPKVYIFRYITEGSFDAYSWQLLETKQRFITDLLSGSIANREEADIEDMVLDYAEVKALAVGNPLVRERVEAANELTRYLTLQRKLVESRMRMEAELFELPSKIEHQESEMEKCINDIKFYDEWRNSNPDPVGTNGKKDLAEKRRELRESIHKAVADNILEVKETYLMNYRGFDLVLPANMKLEKPYIWLMREGKYCVKLGDMGGGSVVRIDNFLNSLDIYLEKIMEGLMKLHEKEHELIVELLKDISYASMIEEYKKKVEALDKKLGVDKSE